MSTTPKHKEDGHGDHPKEEKQEMVVTGRKFSWLLYLVLGLIIFFGILSVISRTKTEANEEAQNESSSKKPIVVTPYVERTLVDISTTWTKVNIPYGIKSIHFRNATVPYCAKNRGGEEHCSDDTEDIIGLFTDGHSTDNLTLWIKTQNGTGAVIVELTHFTE